MTNEERIVKLEEKLEHMTLHINSVVKTLTEANQKKVNESRFEKSVLCSLNAKNVNNLIRGQLGYIEKYLGIEMVKICRATKEEDFSCKNCEIKKNLDCVGPYTMYKKIKGDK